MHMPTLAAATFGLAAVLLGSAPPARAQDALDRVAPATIPAAPAEETPAAPKPRVPIAVDAPSGVAPAAGNGAVLVGAIALVGLDALSPADFADVIAPSIGKTLDADQLAALATALAGRARDRGFVFASAWVEPQRLANGVLTVRIDEGRIDAIRFEGAEQAAVRRALAPLLNGRPARLAEVERRLLIAGDLDGVQVRGSRFFREDGLGILLVRVTEDRIGVRAALSNEGTKPLGPEQLRIDVDLNGLFAADDALTVTYTTTPAELGELQYGRARYAKRVSASGTELALVGSASIARPGAYLEPLDLESRSWFAGLQLLQPLWRRRDASLWLQTELGVRDFAQRRGGIRVRHDRITTARATLHGYRDLGGGRLRVSTTLSQGLGLFDATRFGDPLASRGDADATFTSLSAWTDWTVGLGSSFSLRLAALSQLASQPLLVTEEIGLGGTAFLRGYDWSERTGDEAAMALAELRYLWDRPLGLVRRAQLYAFLDGGKVSNREDGYGGGALASAGGGVRADITGSTGANLELAFPLTGPRYDTDDETPKLSFRLVRSF